MSKPRKIRSRDKTQESRKILNKRLLQTELELSLQGVQAEQIGQMLGRDPVSVSADLEIFRPFFVEIDNVKKFRAAFSDVCDSAILTLLKSALDPEKLAKATVNQCMYAARQLYEMRRLEENKSISNVAIHHQHTDTADLASLHSSFNAAVTDAV